MKAINLLMVMGLLCFISCQEKPHSGREVLENTQKQLSTLTDISYHKQRKSSGMGDMDIFQIYVSEVECFKNNNDTLLGVNFITQYEDGSLIYDGEYVVRNRADNQTVIDTLATKPIARPTAPFHVYTNTLIQYVLDNQSDSLLNYSVDKDLFLFNFSFPDMMIEFMIGKEPWIMEQEGTVSNFTLWLDPDTGLPVKVKRQMPHQITVDSVYRVQRINPINNFSALNYIPENNIIGGRQSMLMVKPGLEGTIAEDWTLKLVGDDSLSFADLSQDVLLMEFTAVGCGPCKAAIPFIKQLRSDLKQQSFELISLETFPEKLKGLEKYKTANAIDYPYVESNKALNKAYGIKGFPIFILINKERKIVKVIQGFVNNGEDLRLAVDACF